MKGASKGSVSGGHSKKNDSDPWTGKGGFTTLDKDRRVVWEPGLPAMVTARRQHNPRKSNLQQDGVADEDSFCDLKATLKFSPEARVDWLTKALRQIPRGQTKAQDVFDIVTHPRFVSGVGNRVGQTMLRLVTDAFRVFSEKQRDAFAKSKLFTEFAVQSQLKRRRGDSSDDEAKTARHKRRSRSRSRSRSARSASIPVSGAAGGERRPPVPKETPPPAPSSSERQGSDHQPRRESAQVDPALREQEAKRDDDRRKMEAERKVALEREMQRKAKLGSAFLVDDEEEEDAPQMPMVVKRAENRNEDRPRVIDYTPRNSTAGQDAPVAAHFVESMGGGSILHEAQKLLLQKAGGEMRSPSIVRRDRKRSRSRRRRRPSKSRSRSRSGRAAATGGAGGNVRSSGSYRSPTPDGRARGQARAARKAKMIASMLGMPVTGR